MSNITGGGIAANIARVIPQHLHAEINREQIQLQEIFKYLRREGNLETLDMEKTFNMGLGVVLITDKDLPLQVIGTIKKREEDTFSDSTPKGGSGGSCSLKGTYK